MSNFPQPTKTRIRSVTINDVNIVQHILNIKVYETVCKPYITATIEVIDKNNLINDLKLVGAEPIGISFYGNQDKVYSVNLRILSVSKEEYQQNLRSLKYTIECIGDTYFNDRLNLVQQSFDKITVTDAINRIHSQYLGGGLNILSPSVGLIGLEMSYIVNSVKPFKAIDDLRSMINFANYGTGNSLYYRDAEGHKLTALEQMFSNLSPVEKFYQRQTWGSSISNYVLAEKSILAVRQEADSTGTVGGRGNVGDVASTLVQMKSVTDIKTMMPVVNTSGISISSGRFVGTPLDAMVRGILQGKAIGGEPNHMQYNSWLTQYPASGTAQTEREKLYSATAKGGPRMAVKVPIQSGVNVTVGKGVYLDLVPPLGDQKNGNNLVKGNWLVIDVCHEITQQAVEVYNGTTTMRCIRGGYD